MEKTYTVDWAEIKTTSTNKQKKDCTLTAEGEAPISGVTIWADFPGFADIAPGSKVTGTLTPAKDPKYGPTLYPPRPQTTSGGANRGQSGGFKAKMIEEHEGRKQGFIREVVTSKEESIKMAGAQRDAVLLTQTLFGQNIANDPILSEDEKRAIIKKEVIAFRDWLLSDDFQSTLPFSSDGTK